MKKAVWNIGFASVILPMVATVFTYCDLYLYISGERSPRVEHKQAVRTAEIKAKRWLLSIVSLALIILVGSTVAIGSYFTDPESSVHNTLGIASSWGSWLTGWCKRVKITIDHNDFDEDVTHFPVLVHLSSACGK